MQKQDITSSVATPKPPWSLLTVTIIALFLPPGGALLTVRSLARLRNLDRRRTAELTAAVFALYTLGLTVLILLASPNGNQPAQVGSGVSTVLSLGTAVASYMVLRRPYIEWRTANRNIRTSSLMTALGTALVYAIGISVAVALLRILIAGVAHLFNWDFGQL